MAIHDNARLGEAPVSQESCPVRDVLDRIGDKWSVLLILRLGERGTMRFNELHRVISGISKRMLSKSLRSLERDGLVVRTVLGGYPPAVAYALSPLGRSLDEPIAALAAWAARHRDAVARSRDAYDARLGEPFRP